MEKESILKEIPISEIEGIRIGHAENKNAATGCTVLIAEKGYPVGVDIRGGGPASRESALLNPLAANQEVHAILLSGGSAYGLQAAAGVMQYLEEHHIGLEVADLKVPIVCASCLFDLNLVTSEIRPDKEMGYQACIHAEKQNPEQGNVGAGTGATVGKLYGSAGMMKSGIGIYAAKLGELKIGAIVAVNAFGDIYDYQKNCKLAGLRNPQTGEWIDTEEACYKAYQEREAFSAGNTTIGAVITNGKFTKTELTKIAGMAHNGYARSIRPVHTMVDGDSIYVMSAGEVKVDINIAGMLSARVVAEAIKNAVLYAESAYGLKAAKDIEKE